MKFFSDPINLVLIVIAVIAGVMLALPSLRRGRGGLSTGDAIHLINRRNAVVLDVRSAQDYAAGHLPQARHLAFADLASKAQLVAKNKATPVIVVCETGQQSAKAVAALTAAGYAEAHSLGGGLEEWRKAGMPVVASKA